MKTGWFLKCYIEANSTEHGIWIKSMLSKYIQVPKGIKIFKISKDLNTRILAESKQKSQSRKIFYLEKTWNYFEIEYHAKNMIKPKGKVGLFTL